MPLSDTNTVELHGMSRQFKQLTTSYFKGSVIRMGEQFFIVACLQGLCGLANHSSLNGSALGRQQNPQSKEQASVSFLHL